MTAKHGNQDIDLLFFAEMRLRLMNEYTFRASVGCAMGSREEYYFR